MIIKNHIPTVQKVNQNFNDIVSILNNRLFSYDMELNKILKNIDTIVVKNGVHYSFNDSWHFNISIMRNGDVIFDNLHVYTYFNNSKWLFDYTKGVTF